MIKWLRQLLIILVELVRWICKYFKNVLFNALRFSTDILVNNAGIIRDRSLNKMSDLDWGKVNVHTYITVYHHHLVVGYTCMHATLVDWELSCFVCNYRSCSKGAHERFLYDD